MNRTPARPVGLTLDTGALIAFERGQQRMRARIDDARLSDRLVTVPSVTLAEAWRGGRARWLRELLTVATVEPLTKALAQLAGELLARTDTSHTIDAIVAVSAAQRGDTIVTSDPDDLQIYLDDLPSIRVIVA